MALDHGGLDSGAPSTDVSKPGFVDSSIATVRSKVDSVIPPETRAEYWNKIVTYAVDNPRVTAFLLANVVLTGPPLVLFILFTIVVFLVSLVLSLLVAVLVTLFFTLFMVGVALFFVLPTVFLTTLTANFIFFWGLLGYYLFVWFNEGGSPKEAGKAVGDKVNKVTGGRLNWLMDSAREKADQVAKGSGFTTEEKTSDTVLTKDERESKSTGIDVGNGLSMSSLADST